MGFVETLASLLSPLRLLFYELVLQSAFHLFLFAYFDG